MACCHSALMVLSELVFALCLYRMIDNRPFRIERPNDIFTLQPHFAITRLRSLTQGVRSLFEYHTVSSEHSHGKCTSLPTADICRRGGTSHTSSAFSPHLILRNARMPHVPTLPPFLFLVLSLRFNDFLSNQDFPTSSLSFSFPKPRASALHQHIP
jgi:hypothetical protein